MSLLIRTHHFLFQQVDSKHNKKCASLLSDDSKHNKKCVSSLPTCWEKKWWSKRTKPSQTEHQTEAICWSLPSMTHGINRNKPGQTEGQTKLIPDLCCQLHGAALASIIILFKRKDVPNQPFPTAPDDFRILRGGF